MESTQTTLQRTIKALSIFHEIHPTITVHAVMVLLMVAERPGITSKEIEPHLRITNSAIGRCIQLLSDLPGELGLITQRTSLVDRRYKHLHLTPAGEALVAKAMPYLRGVTKGGNQKEG